MVLGIPDFWIWSAFLLCIGSAVACVVYGIVNWNKGTDNEDNQIVEEAKWEAKEKEVVEKL